MQGLCNKTETVLKKISSLECFKAFCMIGGSALAVQLHHRLSEDLDFCVWKKHKDDKVDIPWGTIESQLLSVASVKTNVLAMNHIDFLVDGVKVTFFGNTNAKQPPSLKKACLMNNIHIADKESIGVMKLEVLLHRRAFRDYYDLYSLLLDGFSLKTMIEKAKIFSRHQLRTRNVLLMLANGQYFEEDAGFSKLLPKYDVSTSDIEKFMIKKIKDMHVSDENQTQTKELPCKASAKLTVVQKNTKPNENKLVKHGHKINHH